MKTETNTPSSIYFMESASSSNCFNCSRKYLIEIGSLKEQLEEERKKHEHWQSLAMIFHDALWEQIKSK